MKLIFVFLCVFSQVIYCDKIAGDYGDLILGYNPSTSEVSGFYKSFTGMNQEFSCIFFIQGKLKGQTAKIQSFYPSESKNIEGKLTVKPQELTLELKSEPDGCFNVQHFANPIGLTSFKLVKDHPWKAVLVVKSEKAYFHEEPNVSKVKKSYLIKGDAVGLLQTKGSWMQVEFIGKKTISGWIKNSDFY